MGGVKEEDERDLGELAVVNSHREIHESKCIPALRPCPVPSLASFFRRHGKAFCQAERPENVVSKNEALCY